MPSTDFYSRPIDNPECPICGRSISPGRLRSSIGGKAAHLLCVLDDRDRMSRILTEGKRC